jgi:hypothetical protein
VSNLYQFLQDTQNSKTSLEEKFFNLRDDPDDVRGACRLLTQILNLQTLGSAASQKELSRLEKHLPQIDKILY